MSALKAICEDAGLREVAHLYRQNVAFTSDADEAQIKRVLVGEAPGVCGESSIRVSLIRSAASQVRECRRSQSLCG